MAGSYVYFMVSRFKGQSAVKIGYSWNPKLRASQIRRDVGHDVVVAACEKLESDYEARELEQVYHHLFKDFRISGEWFEPDVWILTTIDRIGVNHG